MTIWAIADIHASVANEFGEPTKPMDIFDVRWRDHVARIEAAWKDSVAADDTVIVAGDIEWALHLADALHTLNRIDTWPGTKLMVRGNHDYWWSSKATGRVRRALPSSIRLIHNDSVFAGGFNICGCKGSPVPGGPEWTDVDAKLLNRETERLRLSLSTRRVEAPTMAVVHYPPFYGQAGVSAYRDIFAEYDVAACVYGHLHGESATAGPHGVIGGVSYLLVAADYIGFAPVAIASDGAMISDGVIAQSE